jgi:coenzyme F420-0:L-glutamate ligase/coenzyme F420-1:gamma-L-glutamate ligase
VTGRSLWLEARALPGLPEVEPGADLALLIAEAAASASISISATDVIVVAQKAVSKAEGRLRSLQGVQPSEPARALAATLGRDPRFIQLVLEESTDVVRAEHGVLVTRTRLGHVCANAGIDASNVPSDDTVCLLPEDPDGSARLLRKELRLRVGQAPAVVVSDSFGRPWRLGQVDVAIGCAGLQPLDDRRGHADAVGRELSATIAAVADEVASAAGLAREKHGREAVVVVRGLERYVSEPDGPGARAILRPLEEDLFK